MSLKVMSSRSITSDAISCYSARCQGMLVFSTPISPHLGAHLGVGGKVIGETIQCPLHGWRTGGDGRCIEIPYSAQIPPRAQIRSWPIQEVNGLIMAYHDLQERPPDWSFPEFPERSAAEWSAFRPGAQWRIRSHVQEFGENGMDNAHFMFLHPQQTLDMRTDGIEEEGPVFVHRTFQYYDVFGLMKYFVKEVTGPLVVTCYGLGCAVNRASVDAKLQLHYTFAFFFTPIDEEYVEVNCMLSMKKLPSWLFNEILIRKAMSEGKFTIDQDVPIWESKRYRDKPMLCDNDGPIMRYRKWASQFYPPSDQIDASG